MEFVIDISLLRQTSGRRKSIPEALETRQAELVSIRDGPGIPQGGPQPQAGVGSHIGLLGHHAFLMVNAPTVLPMEIVLRGILRQVTTRAGEVLGGLSSFSASPGPTCAHATQAI